MPYLAFAQKPLCGECNGVEAERSANFFDTTLPETGCDGTLDAVRSESKVRFNKGDRCCGKNVVADLASIATASDGRRRAKERKQGKKVQESYFDR